MKKDIIKKAIKELRANSKKRKFSQTFDLVIMTQGINLKNPEQALNTFFVMKNPKGKKVKICALIDKELLSSAEKNVDKIILRDKFAGFSQKEIKKLASEYDYFVAQANLMAEVAKSFGKILGPKGKMPNPKAGCVVPPNGDLKAIAERLQKTVRLQMKNEQSIKCAIGTEDMSDEQLEDNLNGVYEFVIHELPEHEHSVKKIFLKLTMGSPVVLFEKNKVEKDNEKSN